MKQVKILIVEDDETSASMLEKILKYYSYGVTGVVATGEEAIARVKNDKPDLVLMDIALKGTLDGIQAAETIFQELFIPIVFITSVTDNATFERVKKSMPHGFILKPYNKNMIHATIEMALYKFDVERRLRDTEERNLDILSSIPDIMFNVNADGSFAADIDQRIGKRVWPEAVIKKALPYIDKVLKKATIELFEYALKGEEQTKYFEARFINSGDNTVLIIVRDISERKSAEKELLEYKNNLEEMVEERTRELRKSNDLLSKEISLRQDVEQEIMTFGYAIDQSPDCIIIVKKDGVVEYANKKFLSVSGYSAGEVIDHSVLESGNPVFPEPDMWDKIVKAGKWEGEIYNISKTGSMYYLDAHVTSLKNDKNEVMKYVIVSEDITERKKELEEIERVTEMINRSEVDQIGKELEWQEWKEKMLARNVNRTDKSLFRNINNSFTQGAGFGSLISLFELMNSTAERRDGKVSVDESIYGLITNNVGIAQEAFKLFTNIDWIIANDFELEQISFMELYHFIKAVIKKVEDFARVKDQNIIICDIPHGYREVKVNINREFFYKALFEAFMNAMRFSREKTTIAVMIYKVGISMKIAIINNPDKGEGGVIGIPTEYSKVVFEPFYRLSKLVFEHYKTLDFGLGLTLIEKIINKHGGEVNIENILDHSDIKKDPQVRVNLTISLPFDQ